MSENNNQGKSIVPSKGFLQDLTMRIKLILRLLGDNRVSPWLKLMPIGALAYVIWPLDLLPGPIPIDDAAVLSLGLYMFVEMCPPDVVEEHLKALRPNLPGGWSDVSIHASQTPKSGAPGEGDVVDADYREVK